MKKTLKALYMILALIMILSVSVIMSLAAQAPKNPSAVTSEVNSTTAILSWDKCEGATGYRVFRYVNKSWKALKTLGTTSYAVTGLTPDSNNIFAVKSYTKADGVTQWAPGYTKITVKTEKKDVLSPKAVVYSDIVYLSWNKSDDATGYRIYQKVNGKWKALKTTALNDYYVNNLNALTNYQFCIRSYMRDGTAVYWNSYYSVVNVKTTAPTDIYVRASAVNDKVTLSWNRSAGATGYRIFRVLNGKWTKVVDMPRNAIGAIITGLGVNTQQTFTVRPYVKTDTGAVWGKLPASVSVKIGDYKNTTNIEDATATENSVTLKWNKLAGATSYRVYEHTAAGLKTVQTVNTNSCTVTGLKSDTAYKYEVRAFYKAADGSARAFKRGNVFTAATAPAQSDLTATRYKNTLTQLTSGVCYYDFDVSSMLNGSVYSATPLILANRNKDFYVKETVEGQNWGIIYREAYKRAYMVLDNTKTYYIIPEYNREYFNDALAVLGFYDHDYKITASIDTWNGKKVVCESYYDKTYECNNYFYYSAGQLVGIKIDYGTEGSEVYNVVNYSDAPASTLFTVPSGYTYVK